MSIYRPWQLGSIAIWLILFGLYSLSFDQKIVWLVALGLIGVYQAMDYQSSLHRARLEKRLEKAENDVRSLKQQLPIEHH